MKLFHLSFYIDHHEQIDLYVGCYSSIQCRQVAKNRFLTTVENNSTSRDLFKVAVTLKETKTLDPLTRFHEWETELDEDNKF